MFGQKGVGTRLSCSHRHPAEAPGEAPIRQSYPGRYLQNMPPYCSSNTPSLKDPYSTERSRHSHRSPLYYTTQVRKGENTQSKERSTECTCVTLRRHSKADAQSLVQKEQQRLNV